MADFNITSPLEAFGLQFNRMAEKVWCALPGIIVSFDAQTQTATVRPAIKMKVNIGEGVEQRDMPTIENVPVALPFAQGAGLLLTLPLQGEDECLLVFADRAIDNFVQLGGAQPTVTTASEDTTSPRNHHLSDAVCIPGLISNPQSVPAYNTENIEIRDRARRHYISLGPGGITITDGVANWTMSRGKVTLNAPTGIEETSAGPIRQITTAPQTIIGTNIAIDGMNGSGIYEIEKTLKSRQGTFIDKNGVNLNTHLHTGVQPGPGNTGQPVK